MVLPNQGAFPGTGKDGNPLSQPMANKTVRTKAHFPQALFRPMCLCSMQWGEPCSGSDPVSGDKSPLGCNTPRCTVWGAGQLVSGNRSAGEGPHLTKCSASSSASSDQSRGCMCAGAACQSSVHLFPHSYSLEFLSSVCFVSALNEQEEKGRSLDKSNQGADTLRLPPADMPSPALMRGRGEGGGH